MTAFLQMEAFTEMREFFEALPDIAEQAAVFALNDAVGTKGITAARKEMRKQINFPSDYLDGDRLQVGRRARVGTLEASIVGRDRATSLARFAAGQNPSNTRGFGVTVEVKRGQRKKMAKAFMINLKNGNVGVAVRLKPGDTLRNSAKALRLSGDDNVFLLYGPSVDQVFQSVAADIAPGVIEDVSKKFLKNFTLLASGKHFHHHG